MVDSENPLTGRDEIIEALENVEVGDELTVETAYGYRDNQEVVSVDRTILQFGDPVHDAGRIIDIEKGSIQDIPETPDGFGSGREITKMWV